MTALARKQQSESDKLAKRLRRHAGRAIEDFNMIEQGDRVTVCLSGGKDSYTLLDVLLALQRKAPVGFELVAVNLDQKQPGFPEHVPPDYLTALDVPFHVINEETYSVVKRVLPAGRTLCGLCSRLRRGTLYRFAKEHRMTKIALGHHRDHIIETLFLNMFFGGRLKAMPPKLLSDDGQHGSYDRWPIAWKLISSGMPKAAGFQSFPATCAAARRTCNVARSRAC
ncbi:MAG: tRNA 2-thiocytidine(32) synthetase TtcA [Chromatiales bacterium]